MVFVARQLQFPFFDIHYSTEATPSALHHIEMTEAAQSLVLGEEVTDCCSAGCFKYYELQVLDTSQMLRITYC